MFLCEFCGCEVSENDLQPAGPTTDEGYACPPCHRKGKRKRHVNNMPGCDLCGDQSKLLLKARCHLTAPLMAELDGDILILRCYVPECMREVARFCVGAPK